MYHLPIRILIIAFALLAMSLPLTAANANPLPSSIVEDGVNFERRGQTTFRWKSIVKVYDIGLYKNAGQQNTMILADVPTRLELRYHRALPAAEIVKGGDAILRKNVEASALAALMPRLAELNRFYVDVAKGDTYSLTYVPGKGMSLRHNGRLLTTIPGHDFASAYLSIWLGENPISVDARNKLVGR